MATARVWRMTIWIDVIWNGRSTSRPSTDRCGREWIRVPALIWSGSRAPGAIILSEEYNGIHASPHFPIVLLLNVPWLALPLGTIARMAREHPFQVRQDRSRGAAGPIATSLPCRPCACPRSPQPAGAHEATTKAAVTGRRPTQRLTHDAEARRVFLWHARNAEAKPVPVPDQR